MGLSKEERRLRIRRRIRKTVAGTAEAPRLSVFRSNKEIYAQLIDDSNGKTLAAASSRDKDIEAQDNKQATASEVRFDRGGYLYHGRVKSLADGAREGGLKF